VVKIGLLATLEGPFAGGRQDGMRGAELASSSATAWLPQEDRIIKASSTRSPTWRSTHRKLVEQTRSISWSARSPAPRHRGEELLKSQPGTTFINGSSGAQATTWSTFTELFRFNTEGAQWMVGLGDYA